MELDCDGHTIRTTNEHPFYVLGKGWVSVGEMSIGDALTGHDGTTRFVTDIRTTGLMDRVYNMLVEDWHTYYVGDVDWDVWSHNTGAKGDGCEFGDQKTEQNSPTDSKLQDIANRAHSALNPIAATQRTTTVNVHQSGHISATGSRKPNPDQRKILESEGVVDVPKHGKTTLAPGPTGHHGEQRGIQHGQNINDPVVRQASASGAPHGGKACEDCDKAQQAAGVINITGVQQPKN